MYQEQVENQIRSSYMSQRRVLQPKGIIQTLFFTWIRPVIRYGNKILLDQPAIPQMPQGEHAGDQFNRLITNIQTYKEGSEGMRLVKSIAKTFKRTLIIIWVAAAISTIISMLLPILTKQIITYVESGSDNRSWQKGILLIAIVLAFKFINNLSLSHMFYQFTLFGYNVNNGLSLSVYHKSLKYPTICSKLFSVSQLINYSQVDAQRMTYLGSYTSAVLFFPIQLAVGIYMMYSFIGVSFLAGIGIILTMGLFVYINSRLNAKANQKLLKTKDTRMKLTTQIFNLIRFIKVNAWQKYFFKKLDNARDQELKNIRKVGLYGVVSMFFFWVTTPLILSATFGVYVMISVDQITAEKAFTTIMLFNILQFPLRALPQSITQLTQIWVSLKRIGAFLYADQINSYYIHQNTTDPTNAVQIRDGSFFWHLDNEQKEKLLQMKKQKKQQKKNKKKGKQLYVNTEKLPNSDSTDSPKSPTSPVKSKDDSSQAQTSQIISISDVQSHSELKQSLLSESDREEGEKKPKQARIKALRGVNLDIKKGKLTIILGDLGSGKSSLLYSILGQMKPEPGCFPSINIDGSIALVVQKAWLMSCSVQDNILMTAPKDVDKFQKAIKYSCLKDDLKGLPNGQKTIVGEKGINVSGGQKARINLARALYSDRDIYLLDDIISAVDVHVANQIVKQCVLGYLANKTRVLVTHAMTYAKYADFIIIMRKGQIVQQGTYQTVKDSKYFKQIQQMQNPSKSYEEGSKDAIVKKQIQIKNPKMTMIQQQVKITDKLVEELMLPEDRQRGNVNWNTYKVYIQLNGGWYFLILLTFAMVGWLVLTTLANIQIQRWCQSPRQGLKDLWIFASLSIGSAVLSFFRSLILMFSGIKQGRIAHKKMVKGLLYASIPQFFDRVPIGRILNRVSKDLRQLDQTVSFTVGQFLVFLFLLLGNLTICVYASTPYILIPVVLFVFACNKLKNYYMNAQRQCVRLQNISNSPIVSSFSATINGLPTIRSYDLEENFMKRQLNLVNINKRIRMCRQAMESWFSQRLSWLSFMINISAISYCILSTGDTVSGSMAGLLLAYSFTIDDNVINLTYFVANVENKMISVERVANFMNIQPEGGYAEYVERWTPIDEPTLVQVTRGKVEFNNLTIRYRPGLPSVLKKLTLTIKPGEKIGVVGRTGAGKSTITSSILRLVQPSTGAILIDGKTIVDMPLKDLRSSITLIPQEPVLIDGTLRQNLDPRNEHTDEVLLSTLRKCCLQTLFSEREGLQTKISDSGDNLSIGEKQLICIARAILRNSKLVLIDEATANIDVKADNLIQQTIRQCFKDATVITIAHRIKTILTSDRILVMSNGQVAQFDTPQQLIANQKMFYQLYQQSQADSQI